MSEKIRLMVGLIQSTASVAALSKDPEEAAEWNKKCKEAKDGLAAEFAKLNAVREKLVEALYKVLPAAEARYEEYGDIGGSDNFAHAIEALAANAELEGK